jgi:hypothetical protein
MESSLVLEHYSQSGISLNYSIVETLAINIPQTVHVIAANFLEK